jgi:hypothetical protein
MVRLIPAIFLASVTSTLAADPPRIGGTEFFTKTAWGCQDLNMETWSHPTKQVFIERGVKLEKVSICNDKKLPVFYAEIPYDPNFAHNNNYFHPLYHSLLKANGWWPFAIVATSDNLIIFVTGNKRTLNESLEEYAP